MQCDGFHSRLNELLDERHDPGTDRLLRQHAQACPACQESLQAHVELLRCTQYIVSSPPSFSLASAGRSLAAVAAVLLCIWAWQHSGAPPVEPQPLQRASITPPTMPRAKLEAASAPSAPYLMHQPLVSLRLLSMGDWSHALPDVQLPIHGMLPDVDTDWSDVVSTGMTPIQSSLTTTWEAIRRTVAPHAEGPAALRG